MQQYTIKTKNVSDTKEVDTGKAFRTLDKAIANVFERIDFMADDVSEILICNDESPVYSIKPTGNRQFIVQELF